MHFKNLSPCRNHLISVPWHQWLIPNPSVVSTYKAVLQNIAQKSVKSNCSWNENGINCENLHLQYLQQSFQSAHPMCQIDLAIQQQAQTSATFQLAFALQVFSLWSTEHHGQTEAPDHLLFVPCRCIQTQFRELGSLYVAHLVCNGTVSQSHNMFQSCDHNFAGLQVCEGICFKATCNSVDWNFWCWQLQPLILTESSWKERGDGHKIEMIEVPALRHTAPWTSSHFKHLHCYPSFCQHWCTNQASNCIFHVQHKHTTAPPCVQTTMQVGQKTQKNRMARETINIHANLQSINSVSSSYDLSCYGNHNSDAKPETLELLILSLSLKMNVPFLD